MSKARRTDVWASEMDMIAVVKHVLDNAIRYTREGGRVDLSVGVLEGKALLRTQDNGPGIPLAEREANRPECHRPLPRTPSSDVATQISRCFPRVVQKRFACRTLLSWLE